MKRTLLWAFCSLFAIFVNAQQSVDTAVKPDRTEALPNMIRLNYGLGIMTSKFEDVRETYNSSSVETLSLDYEHLWDNGLGFGIHASQNHFSKPNCNVLFVGGSFVATWTTAKGWRWEGALGMGFARNDLNQRGQENGLGLLSILGCTYKLSRHWGIGVDLRQLTSIYRKPAGWEGQFGFNHYQLGIGLAYLF